MDGMGETTLSLYHFQPITPVGTNHSMIYITTRRVLDNYSMPAAPQENLAPQYGNKGQHASANITPLGAVFTLLSTPDVKEDAKILENAIEKGFRVRKCIKDPEQTVASFAKEFVEKQFTFLFSVCKEEAGNSPCNLTLQYGNGTSTTILLKYHGDEKLAVVESTMRIIVKVVEKDMVSIIHADDSLYEQIESSMSHPRELYISTSKTILDHTAALITNEDNSGRSPDSTILITKKRRGAFQSINASPSKTEIEKFFKQISAKSKSEPDETAAGTSKAKPASTQTKTKSTSTSKSSSNNAAAKDAATRTTAQKPIAKMEMPDERTTNQDAKKNTTSKAATKKPSVDKKNAPKKSPEDPKVNAESPSSDKKRKDLTDSDDDPKAKRTKTVQDANEALRVPTKYALFCADFKEGDRSTAFDGRKPSGRECRIAFEQLSKEESKEYDDKLSAIKRQQAIEHAKNKKKGLSSPPKRPKTSYNLFCEEHKKKILTADPKAKLPDGKALGALYKEISAEEKAKYDTSAAELRKTYNAKLDEYNKKRSEMEEKSTPGGDSDEASKSKGTKRKKRDPKPPEVPLTSFMLYCASVREEVQKGNPDASPKDIAEILSDKYSDLDKKEKNKFEKKSLDLRKKYDISLKEYKKRHGIEDESEDGSAVKEEEKETKKTRKYRAKSKKDPNAPKRPLSSFMLFCADVREEVNKGNPDLGPNEVAKILGKKYRELSKKKSEYYKKEAAKKTEKYLEEVKKYKESKKANETVEEGGNDDDEDGSMLLV